MPLNPKEIHFNQINQALSKVVYKTNKMKFEIIPVVSSYSKVIPNLENDGKFPISKSGSVSGKLFPHIVETFGDLLNNLENTKIVLRGSPQLGKTTLALICSFLELPLWLLTKQHFKHIIFTPNCITMENETREDFKNFRDLYDFRVTYQGKSYTYSNYSNRIAPSYGDEEQYDTPIFRRNDSTKKHIKKVIEHIHRHGGNVLGIPDECHYGTHIEGVLAKIFAFFKPEDRIIASSATPFNLAHLERFKVINCRTYEGYIGYSFSDGKYLDPRYPSKTPDIVSIDDEKINKAVPNLEYLDQGFYKNITSFCNSSPLEKSMNHDEYRDMFEETLIKLWKYCLLKNNPKKAKGFIARCFRSNEEIESFIIRHQAELQKFGITLVGWKADKAKITISQYLKEINVKPADLKIILVSGGARMGVRLDDDHRIYYSLDLSSASTHTAVIQGLIGRQSGFKSEIPTCFVAPKVLEMMDEYVNSLGENFYKAPHQRTFIDKMLTKDRRSIMLWTKQEGKGFCFSDYKLDYMADFLQEFTAFYQTKPTIKKGKMAQDIREKFWNTWNPYLLEIEAALKLPNNTLLRYHKDDLQYVPFINDQGYMLDGAVGFRTMDKNNELDSPLKSDRLVNGMKTKTIRRISPQIHIRFHKGKAVAYGIRLSLTSALKAQQVVMPKSNDWGHKFITQEERENKYVA